MFVTIFSLHTIEGALVAGQLRLVDARFIIPEQGIELRAFELEIELADAGGIVTAFAAIGVDRVIGGRINCPRKTGFVLVLVAVISQRHQPFALDPALGIEREPGIAEPVLAIGPQAFRATI